MAKKKKLTDEEAIAFMILHHGGNPVEDIGIYLDALHRRESKTLKNYWVHLRITDRPRTREEAHLEQLWFETEADAALKYCEIFEIGQN